RDAAYVMSTRSSGSSNSREREPRRGLSRLLVIFDELLWEPLPQLAPPPLLEGNRCKRNPLAAAAAGSGSAPAAADFFSGVLYGYNYYYLTQRQRDIVENLNKEAIRLITGLPKHTWLPDLYAHGNLNKLEDVAEQLMSAQLTRLLGAKAGQAILQEIGRLPSSAPKPPPLPPPPWERPVTLTANAPLPRRMDANHPERRAYHARVYERHVAALDARRHVVYYTDAASGLVPAQGASPTSTAGPHFDSSQPDDSQPDLTERAALAKLERKKILRNLRTAASLFNRHNRMIPPMPARVSRKAQTLVRRTATNTLMLPALRNCIFKDDPQHGYCTACNTLATTQHFIWEYPEHAAARFEALADIPLPDQPNTFEDWVIPQDKPPTTVRLLWNQFCSFFYAYGGPAGLLPRWSSVTANSLQ
ncbi:hypothetical protein HPB47_022368, partial [Ixodes persulcatus]